MTTSRSSPADRIFRFGSFELSEREGELRKNGVRIKLQEHPLRVLLELVSNSGRLVTREELQQKLWQADTFVDFDVGLNTAIRKLRQALNDDADEPRYIETLARRGYRFLAPVSVGATVTSTAPGAATEEQKTDEVKRNETPAWWSEIRPWHLVLSAIALVAIGVGIAWWKAPPVVPAVESVTQLTDDGESKVGRLVTDGSRIYFSEGATGSLKIAQVAVTGGAVSDIPTRIANPLIAGLTHDGSALLAIAGPHYLTAEPGVLWMIPLPAGEPRKLRTIEATDADVFSGGEIVFTRGNEVYVAGKAGSDPRRLINIPSENIAGIAEPSVSADEKRVVFTAYSIWHKSSLLEVNSDGSGVRAIPSSLQNADVCCARWTPNDEYLIFSRRSGDTWDICLLPRQTSFFRRSPKPVSLTNGALSYSGMVPSRDGKQIFAIGTKRRGELVRYDGKTRQFVPFLSGISAIDPSFSSDGKWMAYVTYPDHNLWRSRADGTERLQLTYTPLQAMSPFISPDAKHISFSTPLGEIYVVSTDGGVPQKIVDKGAASATWSPDGNLLALTVFRSSYFTLTTYDLRSGSLSPLPASQGLIGGQWLTQETLVAFTQRPPRMVSFDLRTQKWTTLVPGGVGNWAMSPDYKYLYYTTGGTDPEALRIRVTDHKVETIASLRYLRRVTDWTDNNTQISVAPDGSAVFTRDTGTQEIYALTVKWP